MDPEKRVEIEAATFRHLVNYLRENTDVQNIDLMNLAGFCRNCISKWYKAEAEKEGIKLEYENAREIIYVCLTPTGKRNIRVRHHRNKLMLTTKIIRS